MKSNRKAEFDAVYQKYSDSVFQIAMYVTGNLHTAEDITQEVFLRYYLYTATSQVTGKKTWLMTLSRNLAINSLRIQNHEELYDMDECEKEFPQLEENPEYVFFENMWKCDSLTQAETILKALKEKNERWYDAITYVYGMARKQKEVADAMGMSVESLDSMLRRAKNWIKKKYKKEYDHINCE